MLKKPRGTKDILPAEIIKWITVENQFRNLCARFGFGEIRTPMFESTQLFKRGVGETTDIVQKEMFSVMSGIELKKYVESGVMKSDQDFTLKPEGTAPVVRAFIEEKMQSETQPVKLFYITPCFRHERPQAGRLRQFHQFGIETFGSYEASTDAEVMALAHFFFEELGIKNLELRINSIGCKACKPAYNEKLKAFLGERLEHLCETCQDRYETNPMRIIDCKNEKCQEAIKGVPYIVDNLCPECSDHFDRVKSYLTVMDVPFVVDPQIVRGLDYYNRTAFEFVSNDIGAQGTVCGGGRYDGLIESVGGPAVPGVGFGMGIERLLLTLESQGIALPEAEHADVFVATMGEPAFVKGMELMGQLRRKGLKVEIDHLKRKPKGQFKYADKLNCRFTVVIGDDELASGIAQVKNMNTGEQVPVPFSDVAAAVK